MAALKRWLAAGLSLYAVWWAVGIVQPQIYRASFLLVALVLLPGLMVSSFRRRRRSSG